MSKKRKENKSTNTHKADSCMDGHYVFSQWKFFQLWKEAVMVTDAIETVILQTLVNDSYLPEAIYKLISVVLIHKRVYLNK